MAAILILSIVAASVVIILVIGRRGAAELREEGHEAILLAEMEAHVLATATHADALMVGRLESSEGSHTELTDHAGLVRSLEGFTATAEELRPWLDEANSLYLNEMLEIHERYAASVNALHTLESVGGDLMPEYHEKTQVLEAEIRQTLLEMRHHESEEIYESIVRSLEAETVMLWLVPALFVLAISIAVYALRLQDNRRKHLIATLQASNAEKDQFLATVSHELRTPLTSVLGFIEILKNEDEPYSQEARREMLHLASQEAGELSNLVEDLLVMARADSGALTTVEVGVDLDAQAAQVLEAMDERPRVHLLRQGSVAARGDPARVRQIIRNLLSNAIRYGGDKVQIHIESDHHEARLRVIDNGAGVPERQRQRIFEPYHRVDPSQSPVGSVGLGLAVSRQLARAMNGDLTYRHESGQSIFELSLPAALPPSPTLESTLSPTPAQAPTA